LWYHTYANKSFIFRKSVGKEQVVDVLWTKEQAVDLAASEGKKTVDQRGNNFSVYFVTNDLIIL